MEAFHLEIGDEEGKKKDQQADESESEDDEDPIHAQDFHRMIQEVLKSFVDLMETGFIMPL